MKLLVFNCHEAWVHQLAALDCELDIIVGLAGHHHSGWDARMRPVPPRARLIPLAEAQATGAARDAPWDCIVAHNVTDLMDCKTIAGPRIFVMHTTLEWRQSNEGDATPLDEMRRTVKQYLKAVGAQAVAISPFKAKSWGGGADVVPNGVDPDAYLPHTGEAAAGLRVANQITLKRACYDWDFHERAFAGLPLRIVGHNPDIEGAETAADWDDLKAILRDHRFFVHTADPRYEDGFNMAMAEAMAAGLPVLGNRHPTSPISHGEDGFLSDDPEELHGYAERLLADRDLANEMGAKARETAAKRFPLSRFRAGFQRAIRAARQKWKRHARKAA